MDYSKVKPGDDPSKGPVFDAAVWNQLLQMLTEWRGASNNFQKPSARKPQVAYATDVVMVQNTTSENIPRFQILMLDNALIEPSANTPEFQRRVIFSGVTPTGAAAGRWGVCLDALTPGQIGRIGVIGVMSAYINLIDTSDTAVEAVAGSYIPNSGSSGSADILYVAGGVGTASDTGNQWAIIKIGGGSSGFPQGQYEGQIYGDVTLSQTGFFFPSATPMTGTGT
jgi:hypothetical protein